MEALRGPWVEEGVRKDPPPTSPLNDRGLWVARLGMVARWDQIFGVVVEGKTAVVLMARQPPKPPWVELSASEIAPLTTETFADSVHRRLQQGSYREARQTGLPLEEFFRRVLAGTAIPGALEIPIGPGPGGSGRTIGVLAGGGAIALAAAVGGPVGAAGMAVLAGGIALVRYRRPLHGRRVLVLAPDGCVVGLPTGVQPFGWADIARFTLGVQANRPALEIQGQDGALLGKLDATWFDAPLERVVAVAERYRRRLAV